MRSLRRRVWVGMVLAAIAGGLAAEPKTRGDDWPGFLGPGTTGLSNETGLARTWPADGPKVLWTIDVGPGFGGAAVRDGEVFLLDRDKGRQDVLRCLDLKTGKALWSYAYDAPGKLPTHDGSRNVPTVEEKHVFTVGPFGHVNCIDRTTHRPIWSVHLVEDFKDPQIDKPEPPKNRLEKLLRAQVPEWGVTQSPVMYKDLMILAPQTQKVGLVAYEKLTGKKRWTSAYIGRNWFSHVSPALVTLDGVEQIIMLAQPSDPEKSPAKAPPAIISSIDPETGQILWQSKTPAPYKIPMPQPRQIGANELFITGGYGAMGSLWLSAKRVNGEWKPESVRHERTCAGYIQSPVVHQDHIYTQSFKEHGGSSTGLVCMDLAGQVKWQSGPATQFNSGGFLIADGLIYILNGKNGELNLLEASPAEFKLLAKAKVLEAEDMAAWAPLALSEGKLIVRDVKQMKCLDVRKLGPSGP